MTVLLTPAEVESKLSISTNILRNLMKRGTLRPIRLTNKVIRFREQDVRRVMKEENDPIRTAHPSEV
jgi:predicted site-specific integrase-resolvase